jgi:hypothetical protein
METLPLNIMKVSRGYLQSVRTIVVPANFFVCATRAALGTIDAKTILLLVMVMKVTV